MLKLLKKISEIEKDLEVSKCVNWKKLLYVMLTIKKKRNLTNDIRNTEEAVLRPQYSPRPSY